MFVPADVMSDLVAEGWLLVLDQQLSPNLLVYSTCGYEYYVGDGPVGEYMAWVGLDNKYRMLGSYLTVRNACSAVRDDALALLVWGKHAR